MHMFKEYILPVGGGTLGSIFSYVNTHTIIDTIIVAAIGAAIGYLVKWLIDYIRFDILKRKSYKS